MTRTLTMVLSIAATSSYACGVPRDSWQELLDAHWEAKEFAIGAETDPEAYGMKGERPDVHRRGHPFREMHDDFADKDAYLNTGMIWCDGGRDGLAGAYDEMYFMLVRFYRMNPQHRGHYHDLPAEHWRGGEWDRYNWSTEFGP